VSDSGYSTDRYGTPIHKNTSVIYLNMNIYVYPIPYYFETTPSVDDFCRQYVSSSLYGDDHGSHCSSHAEGSVHRNRSETPTRIIIFFPIAVSSFDAQISSVVDGSIDCDEYQQTSQLQSYFRSIYTACQQYMMKGILFPVRTYIHHVPVSIL